jgi:hypothetical protein
MTDIQLAPDWNPTYEEFLEHFGIKGMHWGVRNARSDDEEHKSGGGAKPSKDAERESIAKEHERVASQHLDAAQAYQKAYEDLQNRGFGSEIAEAQFPGAKNMTEFQFQRKYHISKLAALSALGNNLRIIHNKHVRAANGHDKAAGKLRAKIKHEDDSDDLEHFGVKGMHWGVRKGKTEEAGPGSTDHQETARLKEKARTQGIHSLSNSELKTLNERLNLESNHNRLAEPTDSQKSTIEDFLKDAAKAEARKFIALYTAKGVTAAIKFIAANGTKSVGKHVLG